MKLTRKFVREEKGMVSVLVAVAMVAFAGFAALVADAGILYLNRARMVDALDSAVLAGAQELPLHPDQALVIAAEYALKNELSEGEFSFTIGEDNCSITGTAHRGIGLFFARVIGFDNANLDACSSARVGPLSAVSGIAPFGVIEGDYSFGDMVVLKQGAGEGSYNGWFGALRLGDGGADAYEKNVIEGFTGKVQEGDVIPLEYGNMSGPTRKGIASRIRDCQHNPTCSINSYTEGCSRILIVPFINICGTDEQGHPTQVKMVGFGAFLIDQYVGSGDENWVQGSFIQYVIPGEIGEVSEDYGLYASELYS